MSVAKVAQAAQRAQAAQAVRVVANQVHQSLQAISLQRVQVQIQAISQKVDQALSLKRVLQVQVVEWHDKSYYFGQRRPVEIP